MSEKQATIAAPFILLIFAAAIYALARHAAFRINASSPGVQADVIYPFVFFAAGFWLIGLTLRGPSSPLLKSTLSIVTLFSIFLIGYTLYREVSLLW